MGEALFVLVVIGLIGLAIVVPVGLAVLVFVATRAVVRGEGGRPAAGVALLACLLVVAAGLATLFAGISAYSDVRCSSRYGGGRSLEAATIGQSTGLWPPGLRCRYEFADGVVEASRAGFGIVWVVSAMTGVFGAAVGVVVVGRQFSKKGDMLF